MTTKLSGPMLTPSRGGAPRQAVVLLHGYGADGNDLIALASHWVDILPHALFVSPNAPEPCAGSPFGFQWFAYDPMAPHQRVAGARLARPVIAGFLADLWAQTGLSAHETLLCGFSQGAMMALNVGLSLPAAPMGIIAFSGALITPDGFEDPGLPRPPVCLVHGDEDQVVPCAESELAAATLTARGYPVSYHVSRGVGHGISPDGLDFASRFIAGLLAPKA